MTTQLIREVMREFIQANIDPTEAHWFDATGCFADKTYVKQEPLLTMRPPFEKCVVCFEGKSTNHKRMRMHMITAGTDTEQGIVLAVWRYAPNTRPIESPLMVYMVDDGVVKYAPVDADENIDERHASMILGFVAAWLASLSRRTESYVPSVQQTFTNRRKIAQGKPPTYEWRTVIVEPTQAKQPHRGGTHASPRLHDRRGHLRRLRSGKNVWVRDCKVGDPSKGVVFHDYKIEASNDNAA